MGQEMRNASSMSDEVGVMRWEVEVFGERREGMLLSLPSLRLINGDQKTYLITIFLPLWI